MTLCNVKEAHGKFSVDELDSRLIDAAAYIGGPSLPEFADFIQVVVVVVCMSKECMHVGSAVRMKMSMMKLTKSI
jgi:hypothetical protein